MSNLAALAADLPKAGGPEIHRVDCNGGTALSAAVAFRGPDAEMVIEGRREAFRELFRPGDH